MTDEPVKMNGVRVDLDADRSVWMCTDDAGGEVRLIFRNGARETPLRLSREAAEVVVCLILDKWGVPVA